MKHFAKKSLGQHFLKSSGVVKKIISVAEIIPGETILEIGPGKGILTKALLEAGAKVIAVEKDEKLAKELGLKFPQAIKEKRLVILAQDILEWEVRLPNYKLVANIPYYITGAILKKFLTGKFQPTRMILLVQKEVAKRMVARDKKESLLSLSVKAYGKPRYVAKISKKLFSPVPEVDSALITISDINRDFFKNIDEGGFFKLLHCGFTHKRKVLSSNLKPIFGKNTQECLKNCQIPEKSRAEELNLENWRCLAKFIHKKD